MGLDGELTRAERMRYGLHENTLSVCTNLSSNNKNILK